MSPRTYLSTGQAALRLGVLPWQIDRALSRKLAHASARYGRYRLLAESDLPPLAEALRQLGYLPALATTEGRA